MRGIRTLVIERNDRVGHAPRAKTTNVRTRTHLRRWRIADRLAEASPLGIGYPSDVLFVTRLGGKLLSRIPNASNCAPERNDWYPEHGQWIPQYVLEQVMREHAGKLAAVEFMFNTEFLSASQSDAEVTLAVRSLGDQGNTTLSCDYLVGADGARSKVRDLIGATMMGEYGLSRNYNIVFRAPGLAQAHPHGRAVMYWQVNPQSPSLIGPMDRDDIWFFMPTKLGADVSLSDADAASLIRDATGIDLPYEIISRDEWVASRLIATHYRDRRIFLAGDACHLHPPFGGYGMNMGIEDSVDIGWKLAAVIEGWGYSALLDSYEIERRPLHEHVMSEAVANHSILSNDFWQSGLEEDSQEGLRLRTEVGRRIEESKVREFHTLGTVLGCCYENSPVIVPDGSAPPPHNSRIYTPCSRPGCLAPHAWLADGSSLYDRFGRGFTLLIGRGVPRQSWEKACEEAELAGIPLTLVDLHQEPGAELYAHALTLIRPDQRICWRGRAWESHAWRVVVGREPMAESRTAHPVSVK